MPVQYAKRVIVKFKDDLVIPYNTDEAVEHFFDTGPLGPWLDLKTQFPGITIGRAITSVTPQQISSMVNHAKNLNSEYHPPNFLTYFAVTCPDNVNRNDLAQVLRGMHKWPKVQRAYVQGGPGPSPGVILSPGESDRQGYLGPAPTVNGVPGGIDAKFAWGVPGGDGGDTLSKLRFADIEQGWLISPAYTHHGDLPAGIQLIWGDNGGKDDYEIGHGTAALGIVLALPGNSIPATQTSPPLKDIVGITPNVAGKFVASSWNGSIYSVADAILAVLPDPLNSNDPKRLKPGDVLLIEAQTENNANTVELKLAPVEVEELEFNAIQLATANIVVVEVAGNQGANLDLFKHSSFGFMLERTNSYQQFKDSGAIMVGGAQPDTRARELFNHGSRIDCYAWGEQVITTGFSDRKGVPSSSDTLNCMFDGTSSASAIIAGAALAVQGIKKANLGAPYTPKQMRDILSDQATGTPSKNPPVDLIGVMPDLKKIIGTKMGLAPDVYIRDAVGDNGTTPHTGAIAVSPDIILRLAPGVQNPQATFGQGSGQEDNDALGVDAQTGKDHVVYARVRNRGTADAVNVTATVYWSPVATLLTPTMWTLVGSAVLPLVPKNGDLMVSPPIPWPASQVPASTGHHCFVGFVGNGADPAPTVPANWPSFESFLRDNNNVALRNFNVRAYSPATRWPIPLHFLITGPHDQAQRMRLEFSAKTHKDTQILLQVPLRHSSVVAELGRTEENSDFHVSRIRLDPRLVSRSREQMFPLKLMLDAVLFVNIPKEYRKHPTLLTIRQLYEEREVGRITWRLQPEAT